MSDGERIGAILFIAFLGLGFATIAGIRWGIYFSERKWIRGSVHAAGFWFFVIFTGSAIAKMIIDQWFVHR